MASMTKKSFEAGIIKGIAKKWSAGGGYVSVPENLEGKEVMIIPLEMIEGVKVEITIKDQGKK